MPRDDQWNGIPTRYTARNAADDEIKREQLEAARQYPAIWNGRSTFDGTLPPGYVVPEDEQTLGPQVRMTDFERRAAQEEAADRYPGFWKGRSTFDGAHYPAGFISPMDLDINKINPSEDALRACFGQTPLKGDEDRARSYLVGDKFYVFNKDQSRVFDATSGRSDARDESMVGTKHGRIAPGNYSIGEIQKNNLENEGLRAPTGDYYAYILPNKNGQNPTIHGGEWYTGGSGGDINLATLNSSKNPPQINKYADFVRGVSGIDLFVPKNHLRCED